MYSTLSMYANGNSLFYREVCVLEGAAQEDGDNVLKLASEVRKA